jgi:predicted DNA-binding transcriptional regulator YafY
VSTSPSARAERLVNLVLCLLSTRQYLSAERIRATVPGYADVASDEAFFRMFERDKAELRELGVPLETGRSSLAEPVDGYRIARGDYELPDIDLAPDEATAVALVAASAGPPPATGRARIRLAPGRAAGLRRSAHPDPGGDPDVVEIDLSRVDTAARWVAGHGPDAVVLDPPELRAAVVALLRGSIASAGDTVDPVDAGSAR